MRLDRKLILATFFLPLLFITSFAVVDDDLNPEVTARVVRISYLSGDVQVRRTGDSDVATANWEVGTLNLPLVEGDEIATGPDSLVEVQLDAMNHIRLGANAYVRFGTLRDEGIAVSVPQGTLSFRSLRFDKSKSFVEFDGPDTTISIERAGRYRIDAGDTQNNEVTVTADEDGEARIYTKTSGFLLRSGRSALITIDGTYAGDYQLTNAPQFGDGFDDWVRERHDVVARRLGRSNTTQYVDQDMYGAEDLNDYGDWVSTNDYGYVWRPSQAAISGYANWSPYRYGHWRWLPFYGWTWVNDEPWGWATYHHGRWIWFRGGWVWSPYGQFGRRRSWWQPALVNLTTWNGNQVCWYPLGFNDRFNDFNRGWRRNRRNNGNGGGQPTRTPNPTGSPTRTPDGPVLTPQQINEARARNARTPTFQRIPVEAVVAVDAKEFGKRTRGFQTAPPETAKQIFTKKDEGNQSPPILPTFSEVKQTGKTDILIATPRIDPRLDATTKTGVTPRETGRSMDRKLEQEKIFNNRQPRVKTPETTGAPDTKQRETRGTGVIDRPTRDSNTSPDFNPMPPRNNDVKTERETRTPPIYQPQRETKREPVPQPPTRKVDPPPTPQPQPEERRRPSQPTFEPRREEKRYEPRPEPRPQPRPEPKPEPRREEKRYEPKPQPAPKQESPKPAPPPKQESPRVVERKKEDSRR